MNTNENVKTAKNMKIIIFLFVIAIVAAALSSMPVIQNTFKSYFGDSSRTVLAKVSSFYGVDQVQYLILKVKSDVGLQIEIYQTSSLDSQQQFLQKFSLDQDADAYVTIDKSLTNLALSDVDHDGHLDVLAPSVDRNGNLRLNTFRYNLDLKNFEPYASTEK